MSELAFNMNGEPFEIPPTATGWRVRRMKTKGAPEVVYSREGTPLLLGLEAGVEELRNAVGTPGRYRVDPVEDYRPIPKRAGGLRASPRRGHRAGCDVASTPVVLARTENMTLETVRMALGMANTIVERFAQVMDSSATILRAADGADFARPPRADAEPEATDEDDEQDDDAPCCRPPAMEFAQRHHPVLRCAGDRDGVCKGEMPKPRRDARLAQAAAPKSSPEPSRSWPRRASPRPNRNCPRSTRQPWRRSPRSAAAPALRPRCSMH